MTVSEAKDKLTEKSNKKSKKSVGIGWEIAAYFIRAIGVIVPAAVTMTIENSWVKNGIGLMATFMIIALLVIFKEPIKKASGYAPGVVVFAAFIVIAVLFQTVAEVLLVIGISGVASCGIATPLHLKYVSCTNNQESPEISALNSIAQSLSQIK